MTNRTVNHYNNTNTMKQNQQPTPDDAAEQQNLIAMFNAVIPELQKTITEITDLDEQKRIIGSISIFHFMRVKYPKLFRIWSTKLLSEFSLPIKLDMPEDVLISMLRIRKETGEDMGKLLGDLWEQFVALGGEQPPTPALVKAKTKDNPIQPPTATFGVN